MVQTRVVVIIIIVIIIIMIVVCVIVIWLLCCCRVCVVSYFLALFFLWWWWWWLCYFMWPLADACAMMIDCVDGHGFALQLFNSLSLSLSAARLASSSSSSPPPPWSSSSSLPSSSWFRWWVDSTHTCMVWWQWLWLCVCVCVIFMNNERGRARDIQDCIGTNCMAFHMSLISSGIGASFYYSLGHWPSGLHRLLVDNISNIVDRSILELVLAHSCRNVGSKSGSEGSHETIAFSESVSQSDTRIFIKTIFGFFPKICLLLLVFAKWFFSKLW